MYPPVDTHLPACTRVHPAICTVKRPSVHPWTWAHGSGEASHPHTTDIPTNTPGRTVICVATSGKRGGHTGKKGGTVIWARGPSYGFGGVRGPMYVRVEVHPVLPFWEKMGVSIRMVGWVGGKNGGPVWKKRGATRENPRPMGKMGVDYGGRGKIPLACLGITRESRSATEPVGTRLGRGMGLPPSHMLPSPYGTSNRFLEALGNILKPLDVHTPLPTHPCVHVEAVVCQLGLQVRPGAYRGGRKPEIPKRKSLCDARAGITTRMRDNPLRACEGFLYFHRPFWLYDCA